MKRLLSVGGFAVERFGHFQSYHPIFSILISIISVRAVVKKDEKTCKSENNANRKTKVFLLTFRRFKCILNIYYVFEGSVPIGAIFNSV